MKGTYAEQIKALYDKAAEILGNAEASAEELARADALMRQADELKARATQYAELEAKRAEVVEAARQEESKRREEPAQFKDWTEFLVATWRAKSRGPNARTDPRLKWFGESGEDKAMSGEAGADGGFLIPPDYRAQLYAAVAEGSLVRNGATVIPMASRTVDIPAVEQGKVVEGQPSWFGGLSFHWVGEGSEKPESQPEFRMISLKAKKLVGYTTSSDELVADSAISIGGFLSGPMGFAGGIRFMEDYAFLRGTGGGMPLGILPAPVTIHVPRQTGDSIEYLDLLNMMERCLTLDGAVWIANRMTLATLMQMEGPSGNPTYLWGSAAAGVPTTLLGLPIRWTEKLPRLGSTGDILLANLPYYLIGDRQATTVEATQYDRWRYDETSWRVVHRADGQPWLDEPIPLIDAEGADDTISPFVVLDEDTVPG